MATHDQIMANQQNAQFSTGPRTEAGKAKSSMNRLAHGLYSQQIVLPNEDPEVYATFCNAILKDLDIQNELERELGIQYANYCWRLRRYSKFEGFICTWMDEGMELRFSPDQWKSKGTNGMMQFDHGMERLEAVNKQCRAVTKLMMDVKQALDKIQAQRRALQATQEKQTQSAQPRSQSGPKPKDVKEFFKAGHELREILLANGIDPDDDDKN